MNNSATTIDTNSSVATAKPVPELIDSCIATLIEFAADLENPTFGKEQEAFDRKAISEMFADLERVLFS